MTNWPSPTYSPETGLIYFNAVKSRSLFYDAGNEYFLGSFRNSLRAMDPLTGKTLWTHEYPGALRHQRALSRRAQHGRWTDLHRRRIGQCGCVRRDLGEILWHDELPMFAVTNGPISYVLDGKQYIVVGSGDQLVAYALP